MEIRNENVKPEVSMRFGNSNKRFVIGVHGCSPMQLRFIISYEKKFRIEIVKNMTSLAHLLKDLFYQQGRFTQVTF